MPDHRHDRLKALDLDRVLILDRGNVELALPRGWTVAPDPQPPDPVTCSPVVAFRRGRVEFAWTDYVFASDDPERGERREAHGRLLLAANPWFQPVFTFSYWTDDAAWAVPIWERIVATIELGNGIPLETPRDHWSLRDP